MHLAPVVHVTCMLKQYTFSKYCINVCVYEVQVLKITLYIVNKGKIYYNQIIIVYQVHVVIFYSCCNNHLVYTIYIML